MKGMTKSRVTVALTLVASAVVAAPALAQDSTSPPPLSASPPLTPATTTTTPAGMAPLTGAFGELGQTVISGDMKFSVIRESRSMGGGSSTNFELQPALDYFISPNLSVGGLVGIRREGLGDELHLTTITITPRVGYNLSLTPTVSLWIRGGIGYAHLSQGGGGLPGTSGYVIPFSVFLPFLWHPVQHFFIGAGPFLETDLIARTEGQSAPKTTDIGISSTVGGYFNWL